MSPASPSPFFTLDLPRAHIDELAMQWIARRQAPFSTTAVRGALERLDRRIDNHLRALHALGEEAVRVALASLHEGWAPHAFAGAHALLRLRPEALTDALPELLRVHGGQFWWLDALRHAPVDVARKLPLDHPLLLDAASARVPIEQGVLASALAAEDEPLRRAALLAAGRSGPRGAALVPAVERAAREGDAPERLVAFYALGRIGGAPLLDAQPAAVWEKAIAERDPAIVAAVFGSEQIVARVAALPTSDLATEHIHALGLAGRPSCAPVLAVALRDRPDLVAESLHALHLVVGDLPPSTAASVPSMRPGSRPVVTPLEAARSALEQLAAAPHASNVRLHLGRPLDAEVDLLSHAWLRSLASPTADDALADALPDWLLGGGYAPRGWPSRSLGPRGR